MTHEFDGRKYEKAATHQKEWGARLIAELELTGAERILDLGCGNGSVSAQLAACVPGGSVLGIDVSAGMIEAAHDHDAANLQFALKDINDLDFADEFDVVFSNAALHWVKDHDTLLDNVRRALRKGGYLRFNFAGHGNCSHFFKVIREAIELPEFREHFAGFEWPWFMPDVAQYAELVARKPFRDGRVWGENADRHFAEPDAMVRWIDQPSLVPFLPCVPDAGKKAFRDVVVDRMVAETRQDDGRCFETFRRINVFARR